MLPGRLGLETARIPHADRHGLLWLSRGALTVRDGTLRFERDGPADAKSPLESGQYGIPFQTLSMILLGPGSTVSHDALRLMARHGTALVAVGEDGVRCYTAPPLMPDSSDTARRQMRAWGDAAGSRITIARRMYAMRLGELVPHTEIDILRGIEGARMRQTYKNLAQRYGIIWKGRRYDRNKPLAADIPNQAINHASVAVTSAAVIAVTAVGAIPQLGLHSRTQRRRLRARHCRPVSRHSPASRRIPVRQSRDGESETGRREAGPQDGGQDASKPARDPGYDRPHQKTV